MSYRVQIDSGLCIGTSQCTEVAPDAFTMNEDRTLALLRPTAPDKAILVGAASCPVEAILVFDADTGAPVNPREHI